MKSKSKAKLSFGLIDTVEMLSPRVVPCRRKEDPYAWATGSVADRCFRAGIVTVFWKTTMAAKAPIAGTATSGRNQVNQPVRSAAGNRGGTFATTSSSRTIRLAEAK